MIINTAKLEKYVFFALIIISILTTIYFFQRHQILLYGDAQSRLNISRKIIDNLTPGLGQLGNVWLPLPQLFMLPLVANKYLWQSGLAGAIISMLSYIIGGVYLFKSLNLINKSVIGNLLALSIYALNINLLYLQTTAMSEAIFVSFLCISIYYFLKWVSNGNKMHLIPAALAVSCMTLIRYEALAILLASVPMVFLITWAKSKNYHKAEGNVVIYATLAFLGFLIWTFYLAAIFGDPFYWMNYYGAVSSTPDTVIAATAPGLYLSYFQSIAKYFTTIVWMNGLIPVILALIGIPILINRSIKEKSYYFLPILISFSIFMFMVLTLQRNTPINQPSLTLINLLSDKTSRFNEFNIRYGILMLPMISLLTSYVMSSKKLYVSMFFTLLLFVQFYSYINPAYTPIYQMPIRIGSESSENRSETVKWLNENYDGGLIMISALKHDPQMLQLGYDYKTYIHEGTGKYWKESIISPEKHASWLLFDPLNKEDQVTKFVANNSTINDNFDLVYSNKVTKIYKIKNTK